MMMMSSQLTQTPPVWQPITSLLPHQVTAVAKMLPTRVGALFMEMGTGKTRTVIELARLRQGKYDRVFWFCPVSLKETIAQEWRKHTDLPPDLLKVWDERVADDRLPREAIVHIIGIESLSASARVILAYRALVTERSFVIADESSYIKGHASLRAQRLTTISAGTRYWLILTGTPFTQGEADLYAQMSFLSPKILGYNSFYSFAANHLEYEMKLNEWGHQVRTGRIVRTHNADYLAARIAPYTYQVRKDECLDLPDKLYETRSFYMTEEQEGYYQQAKREILLDLDYEEWSSVAIFHLFSALQSIVCGFWTRTVPQTGEKQRLTFYHRRVQTLMHALAELPEGEPVILWCKYHYAIEQIAEAIRQRYGREAYREFHGGLSEARRNEQLRAWQRGASRFLLATQSAGGHGLTLNNAAYAIFYADGYKFSERLQAEDRNHRIGQQRRPTYLSLCCSGSIDDKIAASLARKENALLCFQRQVRRYRNKALKEKAIQLVKEL